MNTGNNTRWTELDGIRGILSVIVVLGHLHVQAKISWFEPMARWFWMSMEIFFVISGFLVGRVVILGLERPRFLRSFMMRRALRIWPLYYVIVASALILAATLTALDGNRFGQLMPSASALIKQLLYLQNIELFQQYQLDHYVFGLAHTWSVALEEQFYLLCPLLVLVLRQLRIGLVAALLLSGGVASFTLLWAAGMNWWLLPARLGGFFGGLFLAFLVVHQERAYKTPSIEVQRRWLAAVNWLALPALALLFISQAIRPEELSEPTRTLYYAFASPFMASTLFGMLLVAATYYSRFAGGIPLLRWPPLVFLGEISYSTYLWHFLLLAYVSRAFTYWNVSEPLRFVIAIPLIFGIATLSYRWVEQPFLQLKKYWSY